MGSEEVSSDVERTIAVRRVDEASCTAAYLDFWNKTQGHTSVPFVIAQCCFAAGLVTAAISIYILSSGWDSAFLSGALVWLCGMQSMAASINHKALVARMRIVKAVWTKHAEVPALVKICQTADGLRGVGESNDREFPWASIQKLYRTASNTRWIALTADNALIWLTVSDFASRQEFLQFTEWAWNEWESHRPSGTAFEIQRATPPIPPGESPDVTADDLLS